MWCLVLLIDDVGQWQNPSCSFEWTLLAAPAVRHASQTRHFIDFHCTTIRILWDIIDFFHSIWSFTFAGDTIRLLSVCVCVSLFFTLCLVSYWPRLDAHKAHKVSNLLWLQWQFDKMRPSGQSQYGPARARAIAEALVGVASSMRSAEREHMAP